MSECRVIAGDESVADGFSYKVDILTGDVYGAGTDANVLITIYGEDGDSGQQLLDNSGNNFERGTKDHFHLVTNKYLGRITKIHIGHDNTGLGAAWNLGKVMVEDVKSREVFVFPCDRWFSVEEDDGLTSRDLFWSTVERKKENAEGQYTIHIFTGDVWGAGTDANVLVTLYGTKGDSGEHKLDNEGENNFEQGMKDTFNIKCSQSLGTVYKVRIGHDNTGWGPGWFLDKVVVEDDSSGEVVEFSCNMWFATNADDGLITRELIREGFVEESDSGLQKATYTVNIFTGNVWGAGTDANILLTLYGTEGESDEFQIENEGQATFETVMIDTYKFECSYLGDLVKLRIGHDNTGWGPGWYLDKVTVDDSKSGDTAFFPCGKWFATDSDDGLITRVLTREGGPASTVIIDTENVKAGPLGLESHSIPDDHITASSHAPPTPPFNARLNNSVAWCAGDSYDCWLQVDLGGTHCVTSVATQGNPKGNNDYVKKYRLQYSLDGESWVTHEENGNQIIDANEDHNSVKTVSLQQPIVGQFVRFCPVDWYFCPSLRVELYGVPEEDKRSKDDEHETIVMKTEKLVQTEVTDEDEKYQEQTGRHSETQKIVFIHLIHQMTEKKSPSLEECSIHSEDAQPLHPPLCAIREDDIHRLMDWETEGTRGWKRLKRSRDCEVWSRRSQEGGPPITKAIVKLGGVPYDEAVKLLQDWETRRHWDKTFDRIDVLGKFDDPSSLLIHCPIKKHEFGLEILDKDDKNEPYFASAWRNATHPKTQHEKPKPLKLDYLFAGLVVRPQSVDNNSSLVTIICQVKGSVPSQAKGTFLVADPAKWAASLKKFHAQKLKMKAPVTNNSQQHSCCRFFRT